MDFRYFLTFRIDFCYHFYFVLKLQPELEIKTLLKKSTKPFDEFWVIFGYDFENLLFVKHFLSNASLFIFLNGILSNVFLKSHVSIFNEIILSGGFVYKNFY